MNGLGLPRDIFYHCLLPYLNVQDIGRLGQLNWYHNNIIKDDEIWKHIEDRWRRDDPDWTHTVCNFYEKSWYGWWISPKKSEERKSFLQIMSNLQLSNGIEILKKEIFAIDFLRIHYCDGKMTYESPPLHNYLLDKCGYQSPEIFVMCKLFWEILQRPKRLVIYSYDDEEELFISSSNYNGSSSSIKMYRGRLYTIDTSLFDYRNKKEVDITEYKKKLLWF